MDTITFITPRSARDPCQTRDGPNLAYYGKKAGEDVPGYKIVGIAGSGEPALKPGRGYWIYSNEDNLNLTFKEALPQDANASYSYPIGRIYFRNDSSGEIRNITNAVEPPAGYDWSANNNKYKGWFGECTYYEDDPEPYFDCVQKSLIYWWDASLRNGRGDFNSQAYNYYTSVFNSTQGVFAKINYPNISIVFVED
ncbi:MAG: hypothetical protein ACP5T0_11735 [Verrucomicrobiia bacterium]